MSYFSERELGPQPRTVEEISEEVWGAIVAAIDSRLTNGDFAARFPDACPDGHGPCGSDAVAFGQSAMGEVPDLAKTTAMGQAPWDVKPSSGWPLSPHRLPPTLAILDLIEFCHAAVAEATVRQPHTFFRHDDLNGFDVEAGQQRWRDDINRLFARNGLAYELTSNGRIIRIGVSPVAHIVRDAQFATGDTQLDELLERARAKYLSADPTVRREALEQLWAFERAKTIRPGDKKASIQTLIAQSASTPEMEAELNADAKAITTIGNAFRIRHHEVGKAPVAATEVDYLFHRTFALLAQLLGLHPGMKPSGSAK